MTQDDFSRPAPDIIEPGIPATSEMPRNVPPGDEDEDESPPLDVPQGVEDWGITGREQLLDEPLAERVKREQPDRLGSDDISVGGRLIEPGGELGVDEEADAVGELDGGVFDTPTPEEAAMRIEDEPAGLNYDADPGYVEE
jgi:hypothetical protein